MPSVVRYTTKTGSGWEVRYRKPDGRQTRKRGFKTKRLAERWLAETVVSAGQGAFIATSDGRAAVAQVYKNWLARQVHVKPSWAARQESLWRIHVEPHWGHWQVAKIGRPDIRDWVAGMDRAASTVADAHGLLAAVLDEAVDERRIAANPARGVKLPRRRPSEHAYLTHAQVQTLANEVSSHREVVLLLAYTGLRWGEMAALRPKDIDVDRQRIHVVRSASKVNQRTEIVAPKTWERRTVAAPKQVFEALATALKGQPNPDGLLWSRGDGTPIMPPTTTHWFTKAVARCVEASIPRDENDEPTGVATFPRISAHQLRHT